MSPDHGASRRRFLQGSLVSPASWKSRAQKGFDGRVIVGADLQEVPLPGAR